jgi:hypothetical protein
MRPLLVVLAAALVGCGGPTDVQLEQDFTLAIGKSAAIEGTGITVTFLDLLEDSRCPINAVCVTAGNAKIQLQFRNPRRLAEVNTPDQPRGEFIGPIEIRLMELNPVPEVGRQIDKSDYRATFRAIRHNSGAEGEGAVRSKE